MNYSPDEWDVVQPTPQDNTFSTARNISNGLRSWSLSAIPDLIGGAYGAYQGITDPTQKNVPLAQKQYTQEMASKNPFSNAAQITNIAKKPVETGIRGGMGLGSYLTPLGASNWGTRALLGATQGMLFAGGQERQPGQSALPTMATSAVLNAAIPPLLQKGGQALGRMSLGPGGSKLGELSAETGTKIQGTGKKIAGTIYGATEPIRNKLKETLANAPQKISPVEIFGGYSQDLKPVSGWASEAVSKTGFEGETKAAAYLKTLKTGIIKKATEYFQNQGIEADAAKTMAQNLNTPLPLDFWHEIIQKIGKDMSAKDTSQAAKEVAKTIWGQLRTQIAERSGNPEEVNRLIGLTEAAGKIRSNITSPKNIAQKGGDVLSTLGAVAGPAVSALTGNALGLLPTATKVLSQPAIATPIVNTLSNPTVQTALRQAGVRGVEGMFGQTPSATETPTYSSKEWTIVE